ncbi:trypsin-like serine protease [Myxococcota bacterium]|nr:trypsin-like serine protease [Myxococcota bacterium]MBU1382547.1 trypsin-like serine protease [Myxococcota bacterium]MBU1497439.1 trypsin-like serine protease [Myxococcota bacterium]
MKNIFFTILFSLTIVFLGSCQEPQVDYNTITTGRPIFYGDPDTTQAHQAVAFLYANNGGACTGTLIARSWVLTAAHCVEGASYMDVYFGNNTQTFYSEIRSSRLIPHPNYSGSSSAIYNDIALVELSSNAPSSIATIPILPPNLAIGDADENSLMLEFVGFGQTETGSSGVKLTVDHVMGEQCSSSNYCNISSSPYQIPPNSISYGQNGGGPCSGDSGGPAFITRSGTEYVAGVTSYGDQYCTSYGVSTKVDGYYTWITGYTGGTTTTEICTNGIDDDGDGQIDCNDSDCASNPACQTTDTACDHVITVSCNDSVNSTTASGAYTAFSSYNCLNGWTEDGPERIYELDLNTGADVTITLSSGSTNDLDLLILSGSCGTQTCEGGSAEQAGTDEVIQFNYDGSNTFFAVVETYENPGAFTLSVECTGGTVQENCTNGVDDDADGAVDCADSECASHSACQTSSENCTNGVDDDGDGLVDCNDPNCASSPACQAASENCTNGVDDDGDGLIDCADADCATLSSCTERVEDCDNGIDDDGDGAIDCFDVDCSGQPNCGTLTSEICNNGTDDDADGFADCADPDCRTFSGCNSNPEICNNNIDDDGDGFVDCNDSDCSSFAGCGSGGEICYNGVDDDGDGKTDCGDPDCQSYSKCYGTNPDDSDSGCSCSNAGHNKPFSAHFLLILMFAGIIAVRKFA